MEKIMEKNQGKNMGIFLRGKIEENKIEIKKKDLKLINYFYMLFKFNFFILILYIKIK